MKSLSKLEAFKIETVQSIFGGLSNKTTGKKEIGTTSSSCDSGCDIKTDGTDITCVEITIEPTSGLSV
jgi:hypothetical protein